jgi:hypothetical protein
LLGYEERRVEFYAGLDPQLLCQMEQAHKQLASEWFRW